MRKQLELWKDFLVLARFGRAWIIDINGELRLSGGSKQEQREALEWASMFLADRALRINLPPIKIRPIDELKLSLSRDPIDGVHLCPRRQSINLLRISRESPNRF